MLEFFLFLVFIMPFDLLVLVPDLCRTQPSSVIFFFFSNNYSSWIALEHFMPFIESLYWEYNDKIRQSWVGGSRLLCTHTGALWTLEITLVCFWNLRVIQVGEDTMGSLGPLTCS